MADSFLTRPITDFLSGAIPNEPISLGSFRINAGEVSHEGTIASLNYDRDARIIIEIEGKEISFDFPDQGEVVFPEKGISFDFFKRKVSISSCGSSKAYIIPQIEPIYTASEVNARFVRGVVINGPGNLLASSILEFSNEEMEVRLERFSHDVITKNSQNPSISTHHFSLSFLDGIQSASIVRERVRLFNLFLYFLKGCYCGVGNLEVSQDGNSFKDFDIGFTKFDKNDHPSGWFEFTMTNEIQSIFCKFAKTFESPEKNQSF